MTPFDGKPVNGEGSGWRRPRLHTRWWRGSGAGWWCDCRVYARPYGVRCPWLGRGGGGRAWC